MRAKLNLSNRIWIALLVFAGALGLCACGEKEEGGATYLSIEKDGKVQSHIEESFEQSYYSKEELQQSIQARVDDYNKTAGGSQITVDKVEVSDGVTDVLMTYGKAEDYAAFNEEVFFVGTPNQAQAAGYDLNVVLSGVGDAQKTLGKPDILAMEDARLLVMDIAVSVRLGGKALYASNNVTVSKNAKTVRRTEGESGLVYIIFK